MKTGRILLLTTCLFAATITVVPIDSILIAHFENRFPAPQSLPEQVDGIIVLGGAIVPGPSDNPMKFSMNNSYERVFEFVKLAKQYPNAKLVYTGGSSSLTNQTIKEAHFAKQALHDLGIAENRVVFEDQSRNTSENVEFSKRLVTPKPGENWILVTSAQHMPRAIGCFRKADWPVIAFPVDYVEKVLPTFKMNFDFNFSKRSGNMSQAIHEFVGLGVYWLSGRTDVLYPSP